jgi:hypothetical protein
MFLHQEEESQRDNKPFPSNQWSRFMVAFSHVQRPFSGLSLLNGAPFLMQKETNHA